MSSDDQYSPYAARYDEIVQENGDLLAKHIINPAIFSLLGDVQGRSIVDVCCGQGYLSRALARDGARVVGVDLSSEMLAFAKNRNATAGLPSEYIRADITQPLPLTPHFDAAICTLALEDIHDYYAAIQNVSAVLLDSAQFIISFVHPVRFHLRFPSDDYFDKETRRPRYALAQQGVKVHYWHRSLEDYARALSAAHFCIREILEPRPSPSAVMQHSVELSGREKQPSFIVLEAIKRESSAQ